MGSISQAKTGRRYSLASRTLVGRSHRCDLQLPHRSISGEHAVIWWDSERWWVRDLGSRNGTRVDSEALSANEPTPLNQGARLEFGSHPLAWTVDSIEPNRPRAVALDNDASVECQDGILALPDEDQAEVVIYGDPRSGWVLERGDEVRQIADLEEIAVADQRWRLHLPQLLEPTDDVAGAPLHLADLCLRFEVSSDEEHVTLSALAGSQILDLGSRAHHYTLLTLARARLADTALSESERGWVYQDKLYTQLQLDRERLNMMVFRARKQLAAAGVPDARGLIERRVDSQQLRIGVAALEIDRA